ncbi:MAG: hypothetical protein JKY48_03735, partial [Flavobacteriales bacterium]|nr:hypothetical protein [Flavobacteriales bacterium]
MIDTAIEQGLSAKVAKDFAIQTALGAAKLAQESEFEVFYLSVGSAHYEQDLSKYSKRHSPFQNVKGARRSARYVAELFQQKANGKGIMLRSNSTQLLSRDTILQALQAVIKMAKKSKSKQPLLGFYFCGHGVSEGIAWSQFMVPGNFLEKPKDIESNPLAIDIATLADQLLYLGEITDLLSAAEMPYLCLVDACYEGVEENVDKWIDGASAILKFMNEYHSPNPVVFAAPPGDTTSTKEDPKVPEGTNIGPLCRKLMLVEKQLLKTPELSLMDVVLLLSDPAFDPLTSKVTSHYEVDEKGFITLLKRN